MDELNELLDELLSLHDRLPKPYVGHTYPFEKVKEALTFFQSGKSVGKIVLNLE
jgi:hypothetical protein